MKGVKEEKKGRKEAKKIGYNEEREVIRKAIKEY